MKKIKTLRALFVVAVLVLANVAVLPRAFASTLTHSSILEVGGASNVSPMIVGDGQQVMVDFTAVSSVTPGSVSVNFSNFGNGSVHSGSITMDNTTCVNYFASATGIPGSSLTASGSGSTVTLGGTLGAETSGTNYCFSLTNSASVTNPTSGGVYSAVVTVGSDSQTDAFDVLASGGNAYSLTATYGPTFTLALSGTSDTIGALSSSSTVASTGITATVNTNAASGWSLWAMDTNAGLTSTQNGHTINTVSTSGNHTMTTGSDQYALGVSADNTTNYAYGGGTTGGGLSKTAFNQIATDGSPASGTTTVLHELVDVSATTPPATDYTDTITVIGAGSF